LPIESWFKHWKAGPYGLLQWRPHSLQAGRCFHRHILQSGEVALMMDSPSGRAVMSLQAGPGSLLGLPGVVGNEPHSMTAIVRKGSEIRFVTRNDFEDLFRAEPSLQLKVSLILAAEVHSARQAISEAWLSSVRETTFARIIRASATLSATTAVNLGDRRLMSWSRASLTSAMMDAAIAVR